MFITHYIQYLEIIIKIKRVNNSIDFIFRCKSSGILENLEQIITIIVNAVEIHSIICELLLASIFTHS